MKRLALAFLLLPSIAFAQVPSQHDQYIAEMAVALSHAYADVDALRQKNAELSAGLTKAQQATKPTPPTAPQTP